ncbi:MAG TPA: hypothetical protein VMN04_00955, partial [Thermoanaerobaculia bacterium]|nr:hypothetical protein [Thermoanaerobaculia bacterium]
MRRLLLQPPISGNLLSNGRYQGRAKRAAKRSSTLDSDRSRNIRSRELLISFFLARRYLLASRRDAQVGVVALAAFLGLALGVAAEGLGAARDGEAGEREELPRDALVHGEGAGEDVGA